MRFVANSSKALCLLSLAAAERSQSERPGRMKPTALPMMKRFFGGEKVAEVGGLNEGLQTGNLNGKLNGFNINEANNGSTFNSLNKDLNVRNGINGDRFENLNTTSRNLNTTSRGFLDKIQKFNEEPKQGLFDQLRGKSKNEVKSNLNDGFVEIKGKSSEKDTVMNQIGEANESYKKYEKWNKGGVLDAGRDALHKMNIRTKSAEEIAFDNQSRLAKNFGFKKKTLYDRLAAKKSGFPRAKRDFLDFSAREGLGFPGEKEKTHFEKLQDDAHDVAVKQDVLVKTGAVDKTLYDDAREHKGKIAAFGGVLITAKVGSKLAGGGDQKDGDGKKKGDGKKNGDGKDGDGKKA